MLDIHTHILPAVDDGSRSIAQSILMLKEEAAQGVDTVVLTPHYDAKHESPAEFSLRRTAAREELMDALTKHEDMPKLFYGAEVAFFEGISRVEDLDLLCIGDTNVMLVEMPFCSWNRRMISELDMLQQVRGVKPVLAHIERYRTFQAAGVFEELREKGVWLQSNTSFFLRWQTSRLAAGMLKRGLIHFVASDCHDLVHRPPNLRIAMNKIEKKLGEETMSFLQRNNRLLLGGLK